MHKAPINPRSPPKHPIESPSEISRDQCDHQVLRDPLGDYRPRQFENRWAPGTSKPRQLIISPAGCGVINQPQTPTGNTISSGWIADPELFPFRRRSLFRQDDRPAVRAGNSKTIDVDRIDGEKLESAAVVLCGFVFFTMGEEFLVCGVVCIVRLFLELSGVWCGVLGGGKLKFRTSFVLNVYISFSRVLKVNDTWRGL